MTGPDPSPAPGDPAGGAPAELPPDAPGDPAASGEGPPPAFATDAAGGGTVPPVPAPHDHCDAATPPNLPAGSASDIPEGALRVAEAVVFASANPVTASALAPLLPAGCEPREVLQALAARTADRGVALVQVGGGWAFRTATDLAPAVTKVVELPRRLPRAAMEALAIIAWHQPVTRPEIEEIRGASLSQTTLEMLLENGLVAPRGKKETPGRPTLWGTTARFLDQFGLNSLRDLPRREELLPEPGLPFAASAVPPDEPARGVPNAAAGRAEAAWPAPAGSEAADPSAGGTPASPVPDAA